MSIVIHPDRSNVATVSAGAAASAPEAEAVAVLEHSSFWIEAKSLYDLAIPTIVIHLSFVVPPFLTASYVGRHFGTVYLDGYTLANLTGNLMTLALLQGLYNACDTLSPQAFGAGNHREVGLLAIRGFVATMLIIIPVNAILFVFMNPLLVAMGQDEEAARHAWHFYLIYALSFPFNSLYCIVWKFLSSQSVLTPLVICTLASTCIFLPLCLEFSVREFGFLGAAAAITLFYIVESLSLVAWIWYFRPHHPDTWPGIKAWREALAWEPFRNYVILGIGGMLASLEWAYWEALALVIGTLGVVPLSAHTVPTQVMFVMFMFPLGIGIALAIRLGATLSLHHVARAKRLVVGTVFFGWILFGMTSIALYAMREYIFQIFIRTEEEPRVWELCREIWWNVCIYFFVLSTFGIIVGISLGLGMQWTLGIVTAVFLWLVGMPASYYFAVVRGGGLVAAWACIWPPYLIINAYMIVTFLLNDWDAISMQIRLREGLEQRLGKDNYNDDALESLALIESTESQDDNDNNNNNDNNDNNKNNNNNEVVSTVYGTDNKR